MPSMNRVSSLENVFGLTTKRSFLIVAKVTFFRESKFDDYCFCKKY